LTMNAQRTLFPEDAPAPRPARPRKLTIDERFALYHKRRPEVWSLFKQYAYQVRSTGRKRFSADAILHRIRWYHYVEQGDESFKINDDYSSRYARKLIAEDPTFAGFFETRRLRSRGE
jgi:hypothetical protein